jgi:putative ABC transport system permease protein
MSASRFVMGALWRAWRQHPLRALAAVTGVVLGMALTTMVVSVDGSVSRAVRSADAAALVRADIAVRARSLAGFGYAAGRRIRDAAGSAPTMAVLQANARVVGADGRAAEPIAVVGVSGEVERFLPSVTAGTFSEQRALADAPGLFVGADKLAAHGLRVGDRMRLTTPRGEAAWAIVGALPGDLPNGGAIAVGDIESVGFAFKRLGSVDALYVQAPARADRAELVERLQRAAGATATVGPAQAASQVDARSLAIVRSLLIVAGAIGLLSSVVVVFVCWRLLLEDERTSLARLRLTGATPGQLAVGAGLLLLPTTLACGVLGLPLGMLGAELIHGFSTQLVAFGGLAAVPAAGEVLRPAVAGLACGLLVAGAAWLAAIHAFVRMSALEAVRPPEPPPPPGGPRYRILASGLAALAIAAATLATGRAELVPVSLGLALGGATAVVIGTPSPLGRAIARGGGYTALTAGRHVAADARRTVSIVLMVGLSVAASLTLGGVVASYRAAIDRSVASWTQADLFVRLGRPGTTLRDARFPAEMRQRLARLPGVSEAGAFTSTVVDHRGRNLMLQAYDPRHVRGQANLIVYEGARGAALWRALADGQIAISQSMARLDRLHVGDRVRIPGADDARPLTIAAVVDDYVSDGGTVISSLATLARLTGERRIEEVTLTLAPDASPDAVTAAVRRALTQHPSLVVLDRAEFRALATGFVMNIADLFRTLAAAMFLLVLLAATVTLAASLSVRRRMLAIGAVCGVTPRRLAGQLALEVTAMATAAWATAALLSRILIPDTLQLMSRPTGLLPPTVVPWSELALALPAAITVSLVASALVSRATVQDEVIEALRFE